MKNLNKNIQKHSKKNMKNKVLFRVKLTGNEIYESMRK